MNSASIIITEKIQGWVKKIKSIRVFFGNSRLFHVLENFIKFGLSVGFIFGEDEVTLYVSFSLLIFAILHLLELVVMIGTFLRIEDKDLFCLSNNSNSPNHDDKESNSNQDNQTEIDKNEDKLGENEMNTGDYASKNVGKDAEGNLGGGGKVNNSDTDCSDDKFLTNESSIEGQDVDLKIKPRESSGGSRKKVVPYDSPKSDNILDLGVDEGIQDRKMMQKDVENQI